MTYRFTQLSKIVTIFWLVALSRSEYDCSGDIAYHDGSMCALDGVYYASAELLCAEFSSLQTLPYCKKNVCEDCESVQACADSIDDPSSFVYSYNAASVGQLYSSIELCKMTAEEQCYRDSISDLAVESFTLTESDPTDLPDCCHVECDDYFSIIGSVCGSDDVLYNDMNIFCNAYCNNRTLTYIQCGEPGCGQAQNCPADLAYCISTFQGVVPTCGSDGVLYSTVEDYCNAQIAETITSYSNNYCDISGCVTANCDAQTCERELESTGQALTTVCSISGIFYNSIEDYCTAKSIGIESSVRLCNGSPCTSELECCNSYCIDANNDFVEGCGSDYNYYLNVTDYCSAYCNNRSLTKHLCNGIQCTVLECCSLNCQQDTFYSVCNADTFTLMTNVEYCNEECDGGINVRNCTQEGNSINCTADDCDYFNCVDTNETANGQTHNYCGTNGVLYTTTNNYCEALEYDFVVSGAITCSDGSCDDQVECCKDYCDQIVFDVNNEYVSVCTTDTYAFIETKASYCTLACASGTYTAIASQDCGIDGCSASECCEEKCVNIGGTSAVCSSTYELIEADDCAELCTDGLVFHTCEGECTQEACDLLACISDLSGYSGTKVCANSQDGYLTYDTIEAYCTVAITRDDLSTFECDDGSCDSSDECCNAYCVMNNGDYTPVCDENFTIYENVTAFCAEDCNTEIQILSCGDNPCTATECCEQSCLADTYLFQCHPSDYVKVLHADYCTNSCSQTPITYDVCEDNGVAIACDTCDVFKCLDENVSYTYGSVCLETEIDGSLYFGSLDAFCRAAIADGVSEFLLSDVVDCGDAVNGCSSSEDCCLSKCGATIDFETGCDSTNFNYYDLEAFCQAKCVDGQDINLNTCDGDCSETDCEVLSCVSSLTPSLLVTPSICLVEPISDVNFFANITAYCQHLVDNELTINIGTQNNCAGIACEDSDACCLSNCSSQTFTTSCHETLYSVVTIENFCESRCLDNIEIPIEGCTDGLGQSVACDDDACKLKKCLADNESYTQVSVCLKSAIETTYYFDLVLDYCNAIIETDVTDYTIGTSYSCGNADGCASDNECCLAKCMQETYSVGCHPESFVPLTQSAYCQLTCDSGSIGLLSCGDSIDCDVTTCSIKECLNDTNAYTLSTICLETPYDNKFFYASREAFCAALVDNSAATYEIGNTIECAGEACEDREACCDLWCPEQEYFDMCDPMTSDVIDQTEYCAQLCPSETPIIMNTCKDANNAVISCTSCAQFACFDANIGYPYETVCLNDPISEVYFFATKQDYCDARQASGSTDFEITPIISCDSSECPNIDQCCISKCIGNTTFDIKCDSTDHTIVNHTQHCEAICDDTPREYNECAGDCNEDDCVRFACLEAISAFTGTICYSDIENDYIFYENATSYCNAKIEAQDTNYIITNDILCDDGSAPCIDSADCCSQKCLTEVYVDLCDTEGHFVMTQQEYCDARCANANLLFDICYDGGSAAPCMNCDRFRCEDEYITQIGNQTLDGYCANDDVFYPNLLALCDAKSINGSLDISLCTDADSDVMCSDDNDCCLANCNKRTDFEPQCDGILFTYINDLSTFCLAYCSQNRNFNTYFEDDVIATKEQCCTQSCIAQNSVENIACSIPEYVLISTNEQCAEICSSDPSPVHNCIGDCTDLNCNIEKCISVDLLGYLPTAVCGTDGIFYDTKEDFCDEKVVTIGLDVMNCNAGLCQTESECCQQSCINSFAGAYLPRCDTNYQIYDTVDAFCAASCNTLDFNTHTCQNTIPCTATECCNDKCNSETYETVCSPIPLSTTLTQADYCNNKCTGLDYNNSIFRCEGDCNDSDCKMFECETKIAEEFPTGNICGSNGFFYNTVEQYCTEYLDDFTQYILCDNASCVDAQACCEEECIEANVNTYTERCDANYTWFSNVESYCSAKCDNPAFMDLENCGDGQDTLCNENECCQQECNAAAYVPVCDTSFNLLTKDQFCTLNCPNKTYVPISCSGDCDQRECNKLNCMEQLSAQVPASICLLNLYGDSYFYDDLDMYCEAKITAEDILYVVNNPILCSDSPCVDEDDCCVARCLTESYIDGCHPTTHQVVDQLEYCNYRCDNLANLEIDVCTNDDQEAVPCNICTLFECIEAISDYTLPSLCVEDDIQGVHYFVDSSAFCKAKISASDVNFVVGEFSTCSGSNCTDEIVCCIGLCLDDETLYDSCLVPDYRVITKIEYCEQTCTNETLEIENCSGRNCIANDCSLADCHNTIQDYPHSTICIEGDGYGSIFYEDKDEYCNDLVGAGDSTFEIDNDFTCGANGCDDTQVCCNSYCNSLSYIKVCSDMHVLLEQTDFCSLFCIDNVLPTVTACNGPEGQIPCESCELFECLETLEAPSNQSICLNTSIFNQLFFEDYESYCQHLIDNDVTSYTIDSTILCNGNESCTTESDCCYENCIRNGLMGFCESTSLEYISKEEYCSSTCGGTILSTVNCGGVGCNQNNCRFMTCQRALVAYDDNSVCLTNAFNGEFYFDSVTDYCNDKVIANDTNFQLGDILLCDMASCGSEVACCDTKCLSETYNIGCHKTLFEKVLHDEYCDARCNNLTHTDMILDVCYNELGQVVDCDNCDIFECENNLDTNYSSNNVCASDYTYYSSHQDFCEAKDITASLEYVLCGVIPCVNELTCCEAVCQDLNSDSFEPGCSAVDFSYEATLSEYCSTYCENDRVFNYYLNGDAEIASELECCIERCISNDEVDNDVCDSNTFAVITIADQCRDICTDTTTNFVACVGSNCTELDCDIKKCELQDLSDHTLNQVCGNNGEFYDTKYDFCFARENGLSELSVLGCNGNECPTETDCCAQLCINQFAENFTARCDSLFHVYNSAEEFCNAQCLNAAFETHMCDIDTPCSPTECCIDECNEEEYSIVCDVLPSTDLVTRESYCINTCTNPTYENNIYSCDGDCTSVDCLQNKCVVETTPIFPLGNVCGNNGTIYQSVDLFCEAKLTNMLTNYNLCDNQPCANAHACCQDVCIDDFNNSYIPRCDSNYTWYSNVESYCGAKCANPALTDLNNCTNNPDNLCNEDECCEQECNSQSYVPVCDITFNLLTQSQYCNLYCPTKVYNPVVCNDDCTQPICDKMNCMIQLSEQGPSSICLKDGYNSSYFYPNIDAYCDQKVSNMDISYIIIDQLQCSNAACVDADDCCVARCLTENYIDGCNPNNYEVVEQLEFCNYRCDNQTDMSIHVCRDANEDPVPCNSCALFECLFDISEYLFESVCLIDAYDDNVYFATKIEYCESKIENLDDDYLIDQYRLCDGTNCDSIQSCCETRCNNNPANFDTCNSEYQVYNLEDYCNDYCEGSIPVTFSCDGDCTQFDCDVKNCLAVNSQEYNTVCFRAPVYTKTFYDSLEDFCETAVNNNSASYAITDDVDCDGACNNELECCEYTCMESDFKTLCSSTSYEQVFESTYCNNQCISPNSYPYYECESDGTQVDCADCDAFECADVVEASGISIICLEVSVFDEYFFEDSDAYCNHLIGKTDDFTVGSTINCNGDECDTRDACCANRCISRGDVVAVCNSETFVHISIEEMCIFECEATTPSNNDCEGLGCTPTDCARLECENALSGYDFTSICLTTPFNTKHYFANTSAYCNEKISLGDTTYVIIDNTDCGGSNCNTEYDCCYNKCLASTSDLNTCNSVTFDLVTQAQFCDYRCNNVADLVVTTCENGDNEQISCTSGICANDSCKILFEQPGYPYQNVCLVDSVGDKIFFSTTDEYCEELENESLVIHEFPQYVSCTDTNNDPKACPNEIECCLASCKQRTTLNGCTADDALKTPEEICTAECTATPFVITNCGNRNCIDCDGIECYRNNNQYKDDSICLNTLFESFDFYATLYDFCDIATDTNNTDYLISNNVFICNDGNCDNSTECCVDKCLDDTYLTKCVADSYLTANQTFYCNQTCTGSTTQFLDCYDGGELTDCTQTKCDVDHQCPSVFTSANYSYTSICLADGPDENTYFATVADFCAVNGISGIANLPGMVNCKDTNEDNINCATADDCCIARCLDDEYTVGCDDEFNIVTHAQFCNDKCITGIIPNLTFCNQGSCDTCDLLECVRELEEIYDLNTVCLVNPTDDANFFESVDSYCEFLVSEGATTFTFNVNDYVSCSNAACLDEISCCNARCNDEAYAPTCENITYAFIDRTAYCSAFCSDSPVDTINCSDINGQIDCSEILCCSQKYINQYGDTPICGTDGDMYSTEEFCEAELLNQELEIVTCVDGCTAEQCFTENCLATNSMEDTDFPRCHENGQLLTNKQDYCAALYDDPSFSLSDICNHENCTAELCCGITCPDELIAVLYRDNQMNLAGYNNLCLAQCANEQIVIEHTCETDQTIADCITLYTTTCESICEPELNSTVTYCNVTDGFLTAYQYCLLYECDEGEKFNETFLPVSGCESNDCDSADCAVNICLSTNACHLSPIDIICANDKKAYRNECEASCHNTTVHSDCPDPELETAENINEGLATCALTCTDLVCNSTCGNSFAPVCGENGTVYNNTCLAECFGTNVDFTCAEDCRGNSRNLRCNYDCQKNIPK